MDAVSVAGDDVAADLAMLGVTDSPVSCSFSLANSGVQPQDCDMSEASLARKRDV